MAENSIWVLNVIFRELVVPSVVEFLIIPEFFYTPGFLGIFDGPLWLHLAGHKSYVVNGPVEAARLVICIMSSDIYSLQI